MAFEPDQVWTERVGALVLGATLGVGPLVVRLHYARTVDLGGLEPERRWIPHFTISTPFFML